MMAVLILHAPPPVLLHANSVQFSSHRLLPLALQGWSVGNEGSALGTGPWRHEVVLLANRRHEREEEQIGIRMKVLW